MVKAVRISPVLGRRWRKAAPCREGVSAASYIRPALLACRVNTAQCGAANARCRVRRVVETVRSVQLRSRHAGGGATQVAACRHTGCKSGRTAVGMTPPEQRRSQPAGIPAATVSGIYDPVVGFSLRHTAFLPSNRRLAAGGWTALVIKYARQWAETQSRAQARATRIMTATVGKKTARARTQFVTW